MVSLFLYARVIALKTAPSDIKGHGDYVISTFSPICFFVSIFIFYVVIIREKYREENSDVPRGRDQDLDRLAKKFKRN